MSNDECKPMCPCKAQNADEAVKRVAVMLGIDEGKATAFVYLLRYHGWDLVKR